MRIEFGKGPRGLLIAVALVLLSVGLVFALSEVVKEVPGSVTIVRADVLSPDSLGVFWDAELANPVSQVDFGQVTVFRFKLQGGANPIFPIWVKNLAAGQQLVVSAQGGANSFGVWLGRQGGDSCSPWGPPCLLGPGQVLAARLGVGWDEKGPTPDPGSYNFTIYFIGQTPIGPTPTPTSTSQGKIAFVSTRDSSYGEIYVMNADGSGVTRLTTNTAGDYFPAWSPDGTKIAFQTNRDVNGEIYVMNADGSGQANRTNNPAEDNVPAWSPDGSRLAFSSYRDGNWEIYVMNAADGTGQTRLTTNTAFDGFPAWSPGGRIAFASDRDGNFEIYVMNADGTGQTKLTTDSDWDLAPAWSPDGGKIAFYSHRDNNAEIYVMNANGTGQTRLTNNPAGDTDPAWSPDGGKLAFASNRDNNYNDIYVMNANGSGVTRLTSNPAVDWMPAWGRP